MRAFRFALFSDPRLGAPRFGTPALAGDAARELAAAGTRIREAGADFALLAGNLFHRPRVDAGVLADAEEALGAFGPVPVLAIEGERERPAAGGTSFVRELARRGALRCLVPAARREDERVEVTAFDPARGTGTYDEPVGGVRVYALGDGGRGTAARLTRLLPHLEPGAAATLGLFRGPRGDLDDPALGALRSRLGFIACGAPAAPGHDGWAYQAPPLPGRPDAGEDAAGPGYLWVEGGPGGFQASRRDVPGRPVLQPPAFEAPAAPDPAAWMAALDAALPREAVPPDAVVALQIQGATAFPAAELDPAEVAARTRARLGAAHVAVTNRLEFAPVGEEAGAPVDRRAIEREVLAAALADELPEYAARRDELLELVTTIRRRDLKDGDSLTEVLELARRFVERGDAGP